MNNKISLSAYKFLPEIPQVALCNNYNLEFIGLLEPVIYDDAFINDVRNLEYFSLFTSAHGPFRGIITGSSNPSETKHAKERVACAIKACESLAIKKIIFHSGWVKGISPDNEWLKNSVQFWTEITAGLQSDIVVCLENVYEQEAYMITDIIKGVDSSQFKMCLDIGHVNLWAKYSINSWINECGSLINHVHVHNNYGKEDSHSGLTNGNIDIEQVLSLLSEVNNKATWNFELKRDVDESICFINRVNI